MKFIRRFLNQLGYVKIRDYGLIATEAGQIVRLADGAVVGAAPVAPALPAAAPPPPAGSNPPHGSNPPLRSPEAAAVPAPAFAPLNRPPPAAPPPPSRALPFPPRARRTAPPPIPPPPAGDRTETLDLGDLGEPTEDHAEPTRVEAAPSPGIDDILGDPTVIDSEPRRGPAGEPLPRLSRRLAGRK